MRGHQRFPSLLLGVLSWCLLVLPVRCSYPWPLPSSFTNGTAILTVAPSFNFIDSTGQSIATLQDAFTRYQALIFPHTSHLRRQLKASDIVLASLEVMVEDVSEAVPQLDTDESYDLQVPSGGGTATLHAPTVYGALRGLETFSQLVHFDFEQGKYLLPQAPWSIQDSPRFAWRGLLIDTSRHFQPITWLKSLLDSMAYAKLNVLHWHVVDTQSFPLQSHDYPLLWEGAYSPQERYLLSEVADIVEYARARGIRVLPELDMPGHAASWCVGYPDICPSLHCREPLNVANNATFDLIEGLLTELTGGGQARSGLFPDDFFHLGGDEVDTSCWFKTEEVRKWLRQQKFTTQDAYKYFVDRAAQIALNVQRQPVQWVEVFENFHDRLDKRTVVHIWKEKQTMNQVLTAGYRTLLSNYDAWYLDHLEVTWDKVYDNEPYEGVPRDQRHLILGGQAQMWSETVDPSDLENTIWPRAAAFAERLWSAPEKAKADRRTLDRLEFFRCLLNLRGIGAAPVHNTMARSAPPYPGSCYEQ